MSHKPEGVVELGPAQHMLAAANAGMKIYYVKFFDV